MVLTEGCFAMKLDSVLVLVKTSEQRYCYQYFLVGLASTGFTWAIMLSASFIEKSVSVLHLESCKVLFRFIQIVHSRVLFHSTFGRHNFDRHAGNFKQEKTGFSVIIFHLFSDRWSSRWHCVFHGLFRAKITSCGVFEYYQRYTVVTLLQLHYYCLVNVFTKTIVDDVAFGSSGTLNTRPFYCDSIQSLTNIPCCEKRLRFVEKFYLKND